MAHTRIGWNYQRTVPHWPFIVDGKPVEIPIGEVLRGDEWYVFNDDISKIREIRAYYASPVDKSQPVNKLHDFDYAAQGYHMEAPRVEGRD